MKKNIDRRSKTAGRRVARPRSAPAPLAPAVTAPPPAPGMLPEIKLRTNEDRRLRRGHLWVFSNEIAAAPEGLEPGTLAHFVTGRGEFLGLGYYNPRSLIAGRILDRRERALPPDFFHRRLNQARALRDTLFADGAYRWVYGESDDLPGLVIDRFGDTVVIESFAAGIDRLLPDILAAVQAAGPWAAVLLKSDNSARRLEHLTDDVRPLAGEPASPHWFSSEGLQLAADLSVGQKTGFFFDQRLNRRAVAALAGGKTVLDVFCHTGGFGLACAQSGATRVIGVDSSEPALTLARLSAERNGFSERMSFERDDAMEHLTRIKETFDIVVLDPPRFAPSRKHLPQAEAAYIKLNVLGLKRVKGGGFLATASCSQHVDRDTFRQILSRAAHESGRKVKIIFQGGAGPDHPIRPSMPETDYLKFALLHVL